MEKRNTEITDFFDILPEDYLNKQINCTQNLKHLVSLLRLKTKRLLKGQGQKIIYPLQNIYEQEHEDLHLQCEALKLLFLSLQNVEKEIPVLIKYFSVHLSNNSNTRELWKIVRLLNETILYCKTQNKENVFQDNICCILETKLLSMTQENNLIRAYILSTVLPNYINLLSELHQLLFLQNIFNWCKTMHSLDELCVAFGCINRELLLKDSQSIVILSHFWQWLENHISIDHCQQKQAIFILKSWVRSFYTDSSLKCEISCLQTNNGTFEEIWENYFVLLDATKEKQLHLIYPCLNLLNSLKHLDTMWQICVYKKFLTHTQNTVVYYVSLHILLEKLFFPSLNKIFLSAINKNEYSDYSLKVFLELPNFCNSLSKETFSLFIKDILQIAWNPAAAWCFISHVFSEKLKVAVPFKLTELIYTHLKQVPHVYIRNACISYFLNYWIDNHNWKSNLENDLKLLCILKEHSNMLFTKAISNHINIDFVNNLFPTIENILDIKKIEIIAELIIILKYETKLCSIVERKKTLNKKLLVVLYAHLCNNFEITDIEKYVLEGITQVDEDTIELFLKIVLRLMQSHTFSLLMYSKILDILNRPNECKSMTLKLVLNITLACFRNDVTVTKIAIKLKDHILGSTKIQDDLVIAFLELYFIHQNPEVDLLENMLFNYSDAIVSHIFHCLSCLNFSDEHVSIVNFLKENLHVIANFTKRQHFKAIVRNYIACIFSLSFLKVLLKLQMLDVVILASKYFLSLSETFPIISYYLSKIISETILLLEHSDNFVCILIPVIQELYLKGVVIKKDDRVEYCICQEIYNKLKIEIESPNIMKMTTRMSSLASMLQIVGHDNNYADSFVAIFVKKYSVHFNKRYFPDSEIHLQKLRIVQALLTIHPFINSERQSLINFIIDCFCLEIHQPCVRQLMQWLLFCLIHNQNDDYFDLIKTKIGTTSKTQPSSIVAFIAVLVHLTLFRDDSFWFSTIEALIPWTMGAHFKLRVYSQVAIKKLLEEAKIRNFQLVLDKYGYLDKSILSVIEASGQAFYDTLKTDEVIFSIFNPERDYCLETIFVDIPRLNNVAKSEWENVLEYNFFTHNTKILNENRTFHNGTIMYIKNITKEIINQDKYEKTTTKTIQRKITPWKSTFGQEAEKQTGDFILIASLIDKPANLGGLSRTCEVFGVKQLILNDIKILNDKEFKSLSMSSEDWIEVIEAKPSELKEFLLALRNNGYSVIGAEQTSGSTCLNKYKFNKKTALLLGNEKEGIPADLIPILDMCVEIPQFGLVRSLNVHVAGATFIWEYAKQHLIDTF